MGRRQSIDLFGTLGAAQVGFNHCALYSLRRPALVPQERAARAASSFLANARTDWVRGLSVPSIFNGKPMTKPIMLSRKMNAWRLLRSCVNFVRRIVSTGPAKCQPASQIARPIVFRSHVQAGEFPRQQAALRRTHSALFVIRAAKPPASVARRGGPLPRRAQSRRRDSCSRGGRRARAAECWPSIIRRPLSQ